MLSLHVIFSIKLSRIIHIFLANLGVFIDIYSVPCNISLTITLHFHELYLAFLSTRLQFEADYLSYTRSSSRKSPHLFRAYIGLDFVSDNLHILFLIHKTVALLYIEHIICSIEYTILEVSQIQLWILIKVCKVHHYFHSTDEKLKSRDVESLTQAKELANGRAMIQTEKEHSFCIRLYTPESI